MNYKVAKKETLLDYYQTNDSEGLSLLQVEKNRMKFGRNIFEEIKKRSVIKKIIDHLFEVMNIILVLTSALSFYLALISDIPDFTKAMVIFLIVIINIIVAIYQEGRAENALSALKKLAQPTVPVLREGGVRVIPSEDLVVGDILFLNAGNQIGADARLLEVNSLLVDEASLTGESEPIEKNADIDFDEEVAMGDQYNMVYSGTNILNGTGRGVVVAVGKNCQIGKIAELLGEQVREKTPLQKRIDVLAKKLAAIAFLAGGCIFILNYMTNATPLIENLMTAVILGVVAVPETLPVIVTLSLVYGVENMAHKRAIIRNIPAVETLGSASVICTDKTGTLTQNKMAVQRIWTIGEAPWIIPSKEKLSGKQRELMEYFGFASNAVVEQNEEKSEVMGDPTESAIIRFMLEHDLIIEHTDADRVFELPFDSTRKKMTTVTKLGNQYLVTTKGAFDQIIQSISNQEDLINHQAIRVHDSFATDALRVLALSYKFINQWPIRESDYDLLEKDQIFLGIVGMIDPPRKESKEAVRLSRKAGIQPVMITGDHALTAKAIAKELDIFRDGDQIVTGAELSKIGNQELERRIDKISVYARVSPEDKIRIVRSWQQKGHVVAMTGDGVNDAPSLKAANVGVAMGIEGTEVAKSASDIILTDDHFATIVNAIAEGRRVYGNIKKTVYYLLSANVAEVAILFIAAIIGWRMPLTGIQLLYINVLADGIPGFGLSREKAEPAIMSNPPIRQNESLFSRGGYRRIGSTAFSFMIFSLAAFYIGQHISISNVKPSFYIANTMSFLVLTLASTLNIYIARSNQLIFKSSLIENRTIFWTTLTSLVLTFSFALVPFLQEVLELTPITWNHWIIVLILSFAPIISVEIEKWWLMYKGKRFFS